MASFRIYYFIVLLFFVIKCSSSVNILNEISKKSTKLIPKIATNFSDFISVAALHGYKAEKHEVISEDGYILTMHRIPPGTNCTKKTPMLVMHGLLQASEGFIDTGPESPGFVIANDCYDVWFGNVRGNYHSRRHVSLDPDKDLEFWKFSVDEMGLYDIPAMIDRVLYATTSKKLIYVGYSQGGGTFFIMNTERPEYASKISLFVGLAPATRQLNTKSVAFRVSSVSVNNLQDQLEAAGVWDIQSQGDPIQGAISTLCHVELLAPTVCHFQSSVLDLVPHTPAGTSVQNFARYGQAMENEKFTKFDYGAEENMKVYGCSDPPEYNLGLVKVPAVIYHGPADSIVDRKDINWVVSQLPNVLEYIKIKNPLWNHASMSYSLYWKETIYVPLKKYFKKYDIF